MDSRIRDYRISGKGVTSGEIDTDYDGKYIPKAEGLILALDAKTKVGELTAKIPKASGGDRRSERFKNDTAVEFEKPKTEVIRAAGFSPKQVERFEAFADNRELSDRVKAGRAQYHDSCTNPSQK